MTSLRVLPPRDPPGDWVATTRLVSGLVAALHGGDVVQLVLAAMPGDVGWWLGAPDALEPAVRAAVTAGWPGAELVPAAAPAPAAPTAGCAWRLAGRGLLPAADPLRPVDPGVVPVLSAAAAAGHTALLRFELQAAGPADRRRLLHAVRRLDRSADARPAADRVLSGVLDAVVGVLTAAVSSPRSDRPVPAATAPPDIARLTAAAQQRREQPAVAFRLTTGYAAADPAAAARGHDSLASALRRLTHPDGDRLAPARRPPRRADLLSAGELAALVHVPADGAALPYVALAGARRLDTATGRAPDGVVLGHSPVSGAPVAVPVAALMRHAYVVGPTGTGKTTLLARLVLGLVERRVAVVVVDPDGDLTRQVLGRLPAEHLPGVRVLDLTDPHNLPTLNPLWLVPHPDPRMQEVRVARRVGAVRDLFRTLWRLDLAATPQLLFVLDAALNLLVRSGEGTLAQLYPLLTDDAVRRRLLARVPDEGTQRRWRHIKSMSAYERERALRSTANKAAVFDTPVLATVFGDPGPGLRLADVLDNAGLLLVHLPRGRLDADTVRLVGGLVVMLLAQEAWSRGERPVAERPPAVAVIDEFQDLVLTDFGELLTTTRKFNVGLVVANQNLARVGALGAELLATLLANVDTVAAFRLGAQDAHTLAPVFTPATATDLSTLRPHELYLRRGVAVTSVSSDPPTAALRDADDELAAGRLTGRPITLAPGRGPDEW